MLVGVHGRFSGEELLTGRGDERYRCRIFVISCEILGSR